MNGIDYTNDPRAVLIHFNPNHDPNTGRFTRNTDGAYGSKTHVDNSGDSEYNKEEGIIERGKAAIKRYLSRFEDQNILKININKRVGLSPEEIDRDLISKVNPNRHSGDTQYDTNCVNCAIAYSLGSQFGIEAEALGSDFQDIGDIYSIFHGAKPVPIPDAAIGDCVKFLPDGSSGMVMFRNDLFGDQDNGHVVNYEKTTDGKVTLIDNQHDVVLSSDYEKIVPESFVVEGYVDLTNANLTKKSKSKALRHVKFYDKEDDEQ